MNALQKQLHKLLDDTAADLGFEAGKSIKLEEDPKLGFFFRVTRKDEQVRPIIISCIKRETI